MVIGNPTRTEESAIHGEGTERGALGTLAAGGGAKMPKCFEFLSLACGWPWRVEGGGRKKMAL